MKNSKHIVKQVKFSSLRVGACFGPTRTFPWGSTKINARRGYGPDHGFAMKPTAVVWIERIEK